MPKELMVWVEKYRPDKIQDCVLPTEIKTFFQSIVDSGTLDQSLLLCGSRGTGKTTAAIAMCEEMGLDYMFINGSNDTGIDVVRTKITRFATAKSLKTNKQGKAKVVIIDEADYLNAQSTQPALRSEMEKFSRMGCFFILTCNYKAKLIPELHDRCSTVEFIVPNDEKKKLMQEFMVSVTKILEAEGVQYDKKVIAELIMKYFPSWRKCLQELQRYSRSSGRNIDIGILSAVNNVELNSLISYMKNREYEKCRKWILEENSDIDTSGFFRTLNDSLHPELENKSKPMVDVLISQYQFQSAFSTDQQINLLGLIVEIMMQAEWK